MDDLQLLLLSSIKIQLWMFRVAAALLSHSVVVGVTVCRLHAALYQLFQDLCVHVFHSGEGPKKNVTVIFVFIVGFISSTARVKTPGRDEKVSNPKSWKHQMKPVHAFFWLDNFVQHQTGQLK